MESFQCPGRGNRGNVYFTVKADGSGYNYYAGLNDHCPTNIVNITDCQNADCEGKSVWNDIYGWKNERSHGFLKWDDFDDCMRVQNTSGTGGGPFAGGSDDGGVDDNTEGPICPTIGGQMGTPMGYLIKKGGADRHARIPILCRYDTGCRIQNANDLDLFMKLAKGDMNNFDKPIINDTIADYCILSEYEKTGPTNCPGTTDPNDTCMPLFSSGKGHNLCQEWYKIMTDIKRDNDFSKAAQYYCHQDKNKDSKACGCINATDIGTQWTNKYTPVYEKTAGTDLTKGNTYCWLKPCIPTEAGALKDGVLINPSYYALKDDCPKVQCENILINDGNISQELIDQSITCEGVSADVIKSKYYCDDTGICRAELLTLEDPGAFDTFDECDKPENCTAKDPTYKCTGHTCYEVTPGASQLGPYHSMDDCQANCGSVNVNNDTLTKGINIIQQKIMLGLLVIGLVLVVLGLVTTGVTLIKSTGGNVPSRITKN